MNKIITKKEWLEIFPEAREYLEQDIAYQFKKLDLLLQIYKNQLDINKHLKDQDSKDFAESMADIWIGEDIRQCEKRIKEIYQYIRKETSTNGITDEDIERAKDFPFSELIKANKSGYALCPFHKDTRPSFYIRNNWGYCFSCGKAVDTIQFIMETEGLSFIQAVKVLK